MKKRALDKSLDFMKDWLRFLHEQGEVPGFVVAVSYKGKLLFNEAYGYANLESKEKMTPQHAFRVASHSKTFTATAIMQLHWPAVLRDHRFRHTGRRHRNHPPPRHHRTGARKGSSHQ